MAEERTVRFSKAYDHVPQGSKAITRMTHYPKGFEGSVPKAHADAAVEAGAAEDATPAKTGQGEGGGGKSQK
jgi:hypothetical protein